MAWSLSSWMTLTRVFQLLGALAAAGLNGFLTAWVYSKKIGLAQNMVVLELLICMVLVYTTVALILQRTGKRTQRKAWLVSFLVLDILFCTADLGIISMLSRAGLPNHCRGLTKDDLPPPKPALEYPFTTHGFSDESDGQYGHLDKFCGYERSFFMIAMGFVFTYIATIVLGSLSIFKLSHTSNTKMNELLDSLERAKEDNIQLKLLDTPSPQEREPRTSVAPASEGIITRTSSLRSTLTSLTSSTTGQRFAIQRRPIPPPAPALPPRRLSLTQPASPPRGMGMGMPTGMGMGMGAGFTPVPLDEDSAEAALVADGMQHQPHRSHRRGPSASNPPQGIAMPMLLEESAESALVSDGMRPSEPMLPPYEPGSSRMVGHGIESNDMRLSEYVKGETQAQDMKDSGRY